MNYKKLIIVAGASGEIGTHFIKKLSKNKENHIIGVVRTKTLGFQSENVETITCELSNEHDVAEKFSQIKLDNYEQIIYLHTIGVDKFDPRGYPVLQKMKTIDPEVYDTNVNSFKYLMKYLVKELDLINEDSIKTHLKLAMIGGVGDKYAPFVIESFCEAKYILRQYIQSQIQVYPEWVTGLSINVTSTITQSALKVRPNADTTYWLTSQEVAEQGIHELLNNREGYKEIDIIKKSPKYFKNYYHDNQTLYKKWMFETGYDNLQ